MIKDSVRWFDSQGFDHMTAVEAADGPSFKEDFIAMMAFIAEQGGNSGRPAQQATQASQASGSPNTQGLTKPFAIDAFGDTFKVKMSENGNIYTKVYCKSDGYGFWLKWGVTAWEEPYKKLGIDINQLQPGKVYKLPEENMRMKVLYDPQGGDDKQGAPSKVLEFAPMGAIDNWKPVVVDSPSSENTEQFNADEIPGFGPEDMGESGW